MPQAPKSSAIGQINDLTKFNRNGRTHQVLSGDQNEGPIHANPTSQSSMFHITQGQTPLNSGQQNKVKDWRNYNPCNQGAYQKDSKTKGKSKFIKSSAATSTATTNNYSNNNNGTAIIVVRPPSDQQKVICENIKIIKCSESHIVQKPVNVVNLVKSLEKVDKSFMDLLEIKHEGNSSTAQMSVIKCNSADGKSDKITNKGHGGPLAKDPAAGISERNKIVNKGNDGPMAKDIATRKGESNKIMNRGNVGPLVRDTGIHMVKADCQDSKNLGEELKSTTKEKKNEHMTTITQKQGMSKGKSTTSGINNVESSGFDIKDNEGTVIDNSTDKETQNIRNMQQGSGPKDVIPSSFVHTTHTTSAVTEKSRMNKEKRSVPKLKLTDVPNSTASIRKRTETVTQLFESIPPRAKESAKESCIDLASDNGVIAVETVSNALALRFQEFESSAAPAQKGSLFATGKICKIASGTKIAIQPTEDDVIRLQEQCKQESPQICEVQNTKVDKGAGNRSKLGVERENKAVFPELRNSATAVGSLALKEKSDKGISIARKAEPVNNATTFELQGDLGTVPVCDVTTEKCTKFIKAKSVHVKVRDADAKLNTVLRSSTANIHGKFAYDEKVATGSQFEGHLLNSSCNDLVANQTIAENRFPIVRVEKIADHHFISNKKDSLNSCKVEQGVSNEAGFQGNQEMPKNSESTKSEEKPSKEDPSMYQDNWEGRSYRAKADLCAQKSTFNKALDEVADNRHEISKDFTLKSRNRLTGNIQSTPDINASINESNQISKEIVVDNAYVIEKSGTSARDRSPKSYDRNSITEPINSRLRSADLSNRNNEGLDKGETYVTAKGACITAACKTRGKRKRVLPDKKVMDASDRTTDNKRVNTNLKRKRNRQVIPVLRGRRPRPKRNVKRMKSYY